MIRGNKRGQMNISNIIVGIFVFIVIIFVMIVAFNLSAGKDFGSALDSATTNFQTFFSKILVPLFSSLLNIQSKAVDVDGLLIVLTFIMLAIILVATFDMVNFFGEDERGKIIDIVIGIIMAIIAVRYMPTGMWSSLTSPTVALVPTMLVALPFAALIILSIKIKNTIAIKVLWLGYTVFMAYLTFFIGGEIFAPFTGGGMANGMKIVYGIFFILALVMLFFDPVVMRYLRQEQAKWSSAKGMSKYALLQRAKLQKENKDWIEYRNEFTRGSAEYAEATKAIKENQKKISDLGGEF